MRRWRIPLAVALMSGASALFLYACTAFRRAEEGDMYDSPTIDFEDGSWRTAKGTKGRGRDEEVAYSVIVVASNPRPSNLFRDRKRVKAHSRGVISVRFADPVPRDVVRDYAFGVAHDERAERRLRMIHTADLVDKDQAPDPNQQMSHLKAACEDPTERTLLLVTDETCLNLYLPTKLPGACWSNVARNYPYNRPSAEQEQRDAYIPLGPRDNFAFVSDSERSPASTRPVLLNFVVDPETSSRRARLAEVVSDYQALHADLEIYASTTPNLNASQWRDLLLRSRFTVSPGGHNPETFRTFEALEAGSIPIISKSDYTDPAFHKEIRVEACGTGDAAWNTVAASPFAQAVSVDTWEDLPELLDRLHAEPDSFLDRLQADCSAWYDALMNRTYASLLHFGDGLDLWPQAGPILADYRKTPGRGGLP
ncbi:unnamed protein product [Ectocarpus sp. 12 AP-2014]